MSLTYDVRLHDQHPAFLQHLSAHLKQVKFEYSLQILLNRSGMLFDYSQIADQQFVVPFASSALLVLNSTTHQYTRIENWRRLASSSSSIPDDSASSHDGWRLLNRSKADDFEVDQKRLAAQSVVLTGPGVFLRAVAATESLIPTRSARVIWRVLFFGLATNLLPSGCPLKIEVFDAADPKRLLLEISLKDYSGETDEFSLSPPNNYSEITTRPRKLSVPKRKTEAPGDTNHLENFTAANSEQEMTRAHKLRAQGQDFAWIMKQAFLDRIRDLVNSLSRSAGEFSSERHGTAITVDWWSEVARHLNFTDNERALSGLKLLALYKLVEGRKPLPSTSAGPEGLSSAEVLEYQALMGLADSDTGLVLSVGTSASRVLHFAGEFPAALTPIGRRTRRLQLADLVWADFTKPLEFSGAASTRIDLGLWTADLSNISYRLNVNHRDIISRLEFERALVVRSVRGRLVTETNTIHAELAIESIDADFDFAINPKPTLGSILCGIFTFGLCHALVVNIGVGTLNLNDITIALFIVPELDGDSLRFSSVFDSDGSQVDADIWTIGWNPLADIFEGAIESVANVFDVFHWPIIDEIESAVSGTLNVSWLTWPSIWNALNGPAKRATAALFESGFGLLEGDITTPDLAESGIVAPVNPDRVSLAGYAFSARYLNAWLRKLTGPIPRRSEYSATDFAARFGVTLPDPAALVDSTPTDPDSIVDDFERGLRHICGDPPAPLAPISANVYSVTRYQPRVQLAAASVAPLTTTARVSQRFVYRLSAQRTSWVYEPIVFPTGSLPGAAGHGGFVCEWDARDTRSLLVLYLSATVLVEGNLLIGFNEQGGWWLPELEMGATTDASGALQLTPRLLGMDTEREFDGIDRNLIRDALFTDAVSQTQTILSAITKTPAQERGLVPRTVLPRAGLILTAYDGLSAVVVHELQDLLSARLSAETSSFQYFSDGNLVYWPIDIQLNIARYLRS